MLEVQGFTRRESQVLLLLGHGRTSKEIAALLGITVGTVSNHRKSLCRKLKVHSTAELIHEATTGLTDLTWYYAQKDIDRTSNCKR
jgi:DNA-binding CsgD family transcriptional regulator